MKDPIRKEERPKDVLNCYFNLSKARKYFPFILLTIVGGYTIIGILDLYFRFLTYSLNFWIGITVLWSFLFLVTLNSSEIKIDLSLLIRLSLKLSIKDLDRSISMKKKGKDPIIEAEDGWFKIALRFFNEKLDEQGFKMNDCEQFAKIIRFITLFEPPEELKNKKSF